MHQIRGSVGPSPITDTSTHTDSQTTTVQAGESKLSDVARRMNLDANALQQANPNISDNLTVGQQINLPQGPAAQAQQDDDDETVDNLPSPDLPPTPLGDPMAKSFMQAKLDASSQGKQTGELHASDLPQAAGGDAAGIGTAASGLGAGKIKGEGNVGEMKWSKAENKPWDKDLPQTAGGDASGVGAASSAKHIPGAIKWQDITLKKGVSEMKADNPAGEPNWIKGSFDTRKDKWIGSEASDKDSKLTQVPGGDYPSMAEKGEYMKLGWVPGKAQNVDAKYVPVQAESKKVDVGNSTEKPIGYDLIKDRPA